MLSDFLKLIILDPLYILPSSAFWFIAFTGCSFSLKLEVHKCLHHSHLVNWAHWSCWCVIHLMTFTSGYSRLYSSRLLEVRTHLHLTLNSCLKHFLYRWNAVYSQILWRKWHGKSTLNIF